MDSVNLSSLLQAEENKIRTELKADSAIDQNRRQSLLCHRSEPPTEP